MNEELAVSLESPQSGWMSLRLRAGARQQLVLSVSHAPADSLSALMRCLTALMREGSSCMVVWNCEPEEYDFELRRASGEQLDFSVRRYPDHRREAEASREVFRLRIERRALAQTFCHELQELRRRSREDAFAENWRRPFPERELEELTNVLASEGEDVLTSDGEERKP